MAAIYGAVLRERLRERDGPLAWAVLALMGSRADMAAHWPHNTGCAATSVSQSEGGLARSLLARLGCRLNSPASPRCLILLPSSAPIHNYTKTVTSKWLPSKRLAPHHPGPHNKHPNHSTPLPRDFLFGTSEL